LLLWCEEIFNQHNKKKYFWKKSPMPLTLLNCIVATCLSLANKSLTTDGRNYFFVVKTLRFVTQTVVFNKPNLRRFLLSKKSATICPSHKNFAFARHICTSSGNITSFKNYFMFGKTADVHGNLCTLE